MANNPLLTGQITFIENHLVALLAGEYMVRVDQHVQNTDPNAKSGQQFNDNYFNEKRFAVTGARFSLPATAISNIFPPANNQGEYDNVLPHVVLTAKSLPWSRTPDGTDNGKPWLALLLFEQSEIDAAIAAQRPLEVGGQTMVGDLQAAAFSRAAGANPTASTLPPDTVSYPGLDASKPATPVGTNGLDYGENWYDRIRLLDVPTELFSAIAPAITNAAAPDGKGDLELLAHARNVKTSATKTQAGGAGKEDFSVVVCNRLPAPNTQCVAHLVSLENLADKTLQTSFLPTVDAQGNYTPGTFPTGTKYLRLASLYSWRFISIDPKETFTQYLENLDVGPFQLPTPTGVGINEDVAGPLALGYTALNHHTRQGDSTVSWYRGPFVPIAAPKVFEPLPDPTSTPVGKPLMSADQAVRYNPDTGMLDVSYAAAWKIGQLLGLQNQSYATALYNWKRSNTQQTILSLERQVLQHKFGEALGLDGSGDHDTQVLHAAAATLLAGPLKPHLHPV